MWQQNYLGVGGNLGLEGHACLSAAARCGPRRALARLSACCSRRSMLKSSARIGGDCECTWRAELPSWTMVAREGTVLRAAPDALPTGLRQQLSDGGRSLSGDVAEPVLPRALVGRGDQPSRFGPNLRDDQGDVVARLLGEPPQLVAVGGKHRAVGKPEGPHERLRRKRDWTESPRKAARNMAALMLVRG